MILINAIVKLLERKEEKKFLRAYEPHYCEFYFDALLDPKRC